MLPGIFFLLAIIPPNNAIELYRYICTALLPLTITQPKTQLINLQINQWSNSISIPSSESDKDDLTARYPVHKLKIPIDHFRSDPRYEPHTDEKFDLRYWFDATHYKKGGPIIVLHGGETSGEGRLPFLQKGIVKILTEATNGLGVILEHRYYGESFPTADLSTESLRFLTTEQALADSAYFAQNVVFEGFEDVDLTAKGDNAPWIIYGGSYAGAQVAFLRVEYPDIFWGAISSSGVPKAIYDFWEYFEPVRKYGPPECISTTQKFVDMVDKIIIGLDDPEKTKRVKSLFGMGELTHNDDFAYTLAWGVSYWQSVNWDPAISTRKFDYYCGNLTTDELLYDNGDKKEEAKELLTEGGYGKEADALTNRLLNFAGFIHADQVVGCEKNEQTLDECLGQHDLPWFKNDSLALASYRCWPYQVCTEWGYLQVGSTVPKDQMPVVSRLIDLEFASIMCRKAFDIHKPSDVDRVNKYGGLNIEYDRLAFVDGEVDPWRPAGPHAEGARPRKNTLNKPFILIEGAGHHWDENGLFPNETTPDLPPKQVVDAQAEEVKFVRNPRSIELVAFDRPSSASTATASAANGLQSPPRHPYRDRLGLAKKDKRGGRGAREPDSSAPSSVAAPRRWWERVEGYFARPDEAGTGPLLGEGRDRWEAQQDTDDEYSEKGGVRNRNTNRRRWETPTRAGVDDDIMKFSHSIQFNAVPDWSSHYIAYSNLKKLIYSLERQVNRVDEAGENVESAPLLDASVDTDAIFRRALDGELEKICSFFQPTETDLYEEVENVVRDEEAYIQETKGLDMDSVGNTVVRTRTLSFNTRRRRESALRNFGFGGGGGDAQGRDVRASTVSETAMDEEAANNPDANTDDDMDMDEPQDQDGRRRSSWKDYHKHAAGEPLDRAVSDMSESRILGGAGDFDHDSTIDPSYSALYNAGVSLKKRIISSYVSLCDLKSFIQLNRTGFTKALKKYDKILDRNLRRQYMNTTVSTAYPFTNPVMERLNGYIARIEQLYADLVTKGDLALSKRELRLHLREHVVWERNTVWREMIGIERKAQAANMGVRRTLLAGDQDPLTAQRQGDEQEPTTKEIVTPVGRCPVPAWLLSSTFFTLIGIVVIFCVMLVLPIMSKPEQQNCLAMLVFVSLLWSTEAIPLFVTSLLVPFLVVTLRIMRTEEQPYRRLNTKEATGAAFAAMWTPVIMLLLGGFTIAAALSKYDIARRMATFVLSKAGTKPRIVLVTNMFVSMVLSMFISNVAAPVLCFSIIQPMLRNLPTDSRFSKALILGIALASNVGGAASPIASPQNIIALQNMSPAISWGTWFFIALPVCILCIILTWILLLITFRPGRGTTIVPIRPAKDKFSGVQWFITLVTLFTIVLWCFSHELEATFGDMGVIAIIPLVLFFGTGILTKEDFNNFLWTIIILASGGLCLGRAVTSSGLLHTIAKAITERVADFSLYGVLLTFTALILVVATFISHTVAALIMLPLVKQVGASMDQPHPNLLVMGSALICSVAMGLPTSGFPNMTAIMMEVPETGQRYLRVRHFITRGVPASILSFGIVVTVGYGLMIVADL
ncbi:phosphate transporter [Blastomyces parvus]|uniref:Phosphate transporter n=1 Tax=Blastomyces parvus TaxID=2060905 RepID=A0A2B7WRY6_9EURO|nr:phosphate transporter [Blastomyces parvus]